MNNKEKIKEELEKFQKERAEISSSLEKLESDKNFLITRLVELQGIIKYLTSLDEKNYEKNNN